MKYDRYQLDPINSNLGLKQRCPLSPMLFNMYIDDMKNIFDTQCDPVFLQDQTLLNHFLYAHDLILVSLSRNGLQRCLDKLHIFAENKLMTININKSKTMIFNKTGRLIKNAFHMNQKELEAVQNFCYLRFEVKASGTINNAIDNLFDKSKKLWAPY